MEEKIIRLIVICNQLKKEINPAFNNDAYQDWLNRNALDKKYRFRDWVIEDAKKNILKEVEELKKEILGKVLAILRMHPHNSNYSVDGKLVSVDKIQQDEIRSLFD